MPNFKKEIIEYINKNRNYFEISKFDGDIFWYNHIAYSEIGTNYRIVLFYAYLKNQPMHFWLVLPIYSPATLRIGERFYKKYLNNPQGLRNQFYLLQNGVRQSAKELSNSSSSQPEIQKKLYLNFLRSARKFARNFQFSLESIEVFLKRKIDKVTSNKKEKEILTFPLYLSYIQEREKELLKIIQSLPKKEFLFLKKDITDISRYSKLNRLLIKYQKEWGWTFLNYASHNFISISGLLKTAIILAKNLNKEQRRFIEIDEKRKIKIQKLKILSWETKKTVNLLDLLFEFRDQRKAIWTQITVPLKKWLTKFSSIYGLSYNSHWLTYDEQCLLTKNNKDRFLEIIKKRENNCAVCYGFKGRDYIIFTERDALEIIKTLFKKEKVKILKGVPACGGKVIGKIKIILGKSEIKKFKEGHILVASHTTPDYVSIMKKAKAILTERGGITSHATIVSRELGISCIVGIKGLIGNLKDGNLVEVDADKGMVKILKKK